MLDLVHFQLDEARAARFELAGLAAQEVLADVAAAGLRRHEEVDDVEAARAAPGGEGHQPEAGPDECSAILGHHHVDQIARGPQGCTGDARHETRSEMPGEAMHHGGHLVGLVVPHVPDHGCHAPRPVSRDARLAPRLGDG